MSRLGELAGAELGEVRRPPMGDANAEVSQAELRLELPRRAETVAAVRQIVRHLLTKAGADTAVVVEVELAASELSTNAVLHAEGADMYEVRISLDGRSCEVAVFDQGRGLDPEAVGPPALELTRGRGLAIVRAIMDELAIESGPGKATTMRARKRVDRALKGTQPGRNELVSVVAGTIHQFSRVVTTLGGAMK